MKLIFATGVLLAASCFPANAQDSIKNQCANVLYQVSTISRLLDGGYNGVSFYRGVMARGDFGLGTFDRLDGEMIAVDGEFYQVKSDGIAYPVTEDMLTPFAAVTFFEPAENFRVDIQMDCDALQETIKSRLPSDELLYAIKITGEFSSLTTRSVPAQEKPFKPLVEVLLEQVEFNFDDIDATLAGFWLPEELGNVNAPGFHFHAITSDALSGGHVLGCEVQNVLVEIDYMDEMRVKFSTLRRDPGKAPPCPANGKRAKPCHSDQSCGK